MSQATTVALDDSDSASSGSRTLSYHSETELIPTLQPDYVSLTQQQSQGSEGSSRRRSPRLAMLRTASSKTDSIRSGKSIINDLMSRKLQKIQESESIQSADSRSYRSKPSPKPKKSSPARSKKGSLRPKLILKEV